MKYYLRLLDEKEFGFILDEINTVIKTDIPISEEEYTSFFNLQAEGKQFKLKEQLPQTGGLFDYIEEYIPEQPEPLPLVFSIQKEADVLTKTSDNIIFNDENSSGGGTIPVMLIY